MLPTAALPPFITQTSQMRVSRRKMVRPLRSSMRSISHGSTRLPPLAIIA
ncbi:MAG: hypothetical protein WDN72_03350 [Alphaproteobacteria bacterium]